MNPLQEEENTGTDTLNATKNSVYDIISKYRSNTAV